MTIVINGTTGISGVDGSAVTPAVQGTDTNTGVFFPAADTIAFTTGGTEDMRIDSSGNVGIGAASPTSTTKFYVEQSAGNVLGYFNSTAASQNARVRINSTDTASSVAYVWSYSDASLNKQASIYLTSTGSLATQVGQTAGAEPTTGTTAMFIDSSGNVGIGRTPPSSAYRLSIKSTGTTSSSFATYVENSSGTVLQQLRDDGTFENYGGMKVMSAAGLGYGTGSGGTVTQATSKTTAVTLNKPTGQITMNNAALAAGATATFIVNNTLVTTSDTVVLTPSNNANYTAICTATTAGSFYVRVTNITGGSLSEALVISFAIIKGATS